MIVTKALTKRFKGFRKPSIMAVDNIDLEVPDGEIFGYLGPNGAGKTTTIKMLSTILPPTSGTATVAGFDILREPLSVKKHIGLMPENAGFNENLTGFKVLMYYGEFYGVKRRERKKRAMDLLEDVGLGGAGLRKVKGYSHGMRKRLGLAVALFNRPELLILDEPTSGLDPQGTYEFRNRIKSLNREGITIFLSSHLLAEVEQMCTTVGILFRGKIVDEGSIDYLQNKLEEGQAGMTVTFRSGEIDEELLGSLRESEGILAGQKVGQEYFFRVDSRRRIPYINGKLVDNDVDVFSIDIKHVSLEDIYLSLTGGESK